MSQLIVGKTVLRGIAASLVALLLAAGSSRADSKQIPVLHIGTTETSAEENIPQGSDETVAEITFQHLIQEVTGIGSKVIAVENHEVLAERLASGRLQLGVFMGYEFAWAQSKHPKLKILAVNVNHHAYQYPALVVHRDSPVRVLADLSGETLALPRWAQGYGRLFIAGQARLAGQEPGAFLGHISSFEDSETPLDQVVDKTQQAAVVDRFALEAYQRRKPGRFARLKKLSESPPMPPPVIAYYDGNLDPETVTHWRDAFIHAHEHVGGENLLLLFRLTRFAEPSPDLERVLAATRKTYPAPALQRRAEAHPVTDPEEPLHFPAEPVLFTGASSPTREPQKGEPEYYLSVFAYDSVPRRARNSHTFATFIKSVGGSVEAYTISWLPENKHVEVARTQGEPGMNLDLQQTLHFAQGLSARVYQWGPYRIRPELYRRGLRQIERLNSGRIQYKALDGAWRPNAASNCIHAVSDIDAGAGYLTVDGAYGAEASARVVEHLSRWMIQPGRDHPSIQGKLGLSGQPITRVPYVQARPLAMRP